MKANRHGAGLATAVIALCLGTGRQAWPGISLTSQFIDVVLEGLKPGRSYNLREIRGVPYTIKNRSTVALDVQVEPIAPSSQTLQAPYEPIPDPNWIALNPTRFRLEPGEAGFADITITIPDDPSLLNRHFKGLIWGHTAGRGFFGVGVESSMRFSIGKGPETLEEEIRQKAMVELNYDLWPATLHILKARVGSYDVKKEERKSLKLTNRSEKELELVFKAVSWRQSLAQLPAGVERIEDLSWVKFEPETVRVAAESLEEVRLLMDVPESIRGKKAAFVVELRLPIGTIVSASHRIYVTVEP